MIRVSTKGDYGTVLMTYLAKNYGKPVIPLSQIAKKENLPFPYLQKLSNELKKAGLIISKEGVGGGIKLSKNPSEISIGEIVKILEGDNGLVKCGSCKIVQFCPSRRPWQKIFNLMFNELNKMKLSEVANGR